MIDTYRKCAIEGEKMNIADFVMLLGGVAMFLFGMAFMGEGLKKVAGDKLELILYKLSSTPLKGILLGTGITAIIQSSSATSVMVVGFVNAEMMKVKQAISVIMGAIIGTSITGWIICLSSLHGEAEGVIGLLSTESISAIAAIAGILLRMISKKKTLKNVGDILLGFAILMFGMKTMSSSVSGLKESPQFISIITSFKNPILGILLGLVFTAILQSASATVGILQALSSTGAITFDIALPIILGIAIGASVPVIMSSIGSTTNGKRAAFSYPLIEILRVIIFAAVFYGINAVISFGFMNSTMNMVSIALLNTVFRISTIIILAPWINRIEKILKKMFKRSPEEIKEYKEFNRLEPRFLAYPPLAIEQTRLAMNNMASLTKKCFYLAKGLLDEYSDKTVAEVERLEKLIDKYEDKIGNYLMQLIGEDLSKVQNAAVSEYLHVLSDFERMSDHSRDIAHSAEEIHEKKIKLTIFANSEMMVLADATAEAVSMATKGFTDNNQDAAFTTEPIEDTVKHLCETVKANHVKRLKSGECSLNHGYVFNDLLTAFERVAAHCSNIALTTIEINEDTLANHEYEKDIKKRRAEDYARLLEEYGEKYKVLEK